MAGVTLAAGLIVGVVGCSTQEIISSNPRARADGIREFEAGNYADAAGSFRAALRSDPRDYKSQFYLAQSHDRMGQHQQAIQAFKASLDTQYRTLAGQEDREQRLRTTEALAACISRSDQRDMEINAIEQQARSGNQAQDYFLLAKIYQSRGDADMALDAYNRASLRDPNDFIIAREYGLFLERIGQPAKAEQQLRKAYGMKPSDEQVNLALRRMGIVPGPGLKSEDQLVRPPLPEGPLPEVNLSTFRLGGGQKDQAPPAPPAPTASAPGASYTPPPPTADSMPTVPQAVSQPRD